MNETYLDRLSEEWNKENEIVIWGFGTVAKRILPKITEDFNISFIIDNSVGEAEKNHMTIPIMTFNKAIRRYDLTKYKIVVATAARSYYEIRKCLDENGLKEYIHFCHIEQFITEWYWKNKNKAYILRADTVVTTKCSLNCTHCNMFIPHYKETNNMTIENIKYNADLIFSNLDFIFYYILIGGEPFLNPDIGEMIEYIFINYSKQIGRMSIITNGTILLQKDILMILKKYDVELSISDYTEEVDYQENLSKLTAKLDKEGIRYAINKSISWSDFGFPITPFSFSDGEEAMIHMQNCSPLFLGINDGKVSYCNVAWSAEKSNLFQTDTNETFDLRIQPEHMLDRKRLLEYSLGNVPNGYLQFCKVCGGCGSDNLRFVKAGCQTKRR